MKFSPLDSTKFETHELRTTISLLREQLQLQEDLSHQRCNDAVSEAEKTIRHLEGMVGTLRAELEAGSRELQTRILAACARRDEEIRQLQETIALLRGRLEEATPYMEKMQDEQSTGELNRHLQGTVRTMRHQLEKIWEIHNLRSEEQEQAFEKERRHLQDTIRALRMQMESQHAHS
jgi:chromosome segregation ATPase